MAILNPGYNVIIQNKVGGVNTPIYPFTKVENVVDAQGKTLDTVIAGLAKANHGNHVPDFAGETVSSLRFLRNDNTWATIQSASTTQAGVVQLSDATDLEDSNFAATAKAVKLVMDQAKAVSDTVTANYVLKAQLGAASADGVTGVATLDEHGFVPAAQLPSYVDDVIDVQMSVDLLSAVDGNGQPITPESGKIYVDAIGENATDKTYRWSGTKFVVISDTLALGETAATAFDGARGKVAYDHSQAAHARVDATKTAGSDNNGYIKINDTEVLVYVHPTADGASATNPHGTTAADLGLGKVENKTAEEILNELTKEQTVAALGYTPADASVLASSTNAGLMSAEHAAKMANVSEVAITETSNEPTFVGSGIWFEIVSKDNVTEA